MSFLIFKYITSKVSITFKQFSKHFTSKLPKMSVPLANVASENLNDDQIKTFKDFLVSYNKLTEMCFNACVTDFTTRIVKPKEEKCSLNCLEKFLKANQRISQRFQEFQIVANENAIATAQKMGQMPS